MSELQIKNNNRDKEISSIQKSNTKRHLKIPLKKIVIILGGILLVYFIYTTINIFISPDKNIQQIYLVPENATFIIHSNSPVDDWKKFSNSLVWKDLKQTSYFEDISQNVEKLDSVIRNNKNLLSLVGKRDLLISIHPIRSNHWDALMILDMQKVSKINILKEQIEVFLKMTDFIVTSREYKNVPILEMRDPETRNILYAAFVDNHFIASYTSQLVQSAIDSKEDPKIGLEYSFIEAEKKIANKGLFRLFINYSTLPEFMSIYLRENNEYIDVFSHSMDYAGFYLDLNSNKMEIKGHTFMKDIADPYVTALLNSGKHSMEAHKILSARTAFYANIGFNDPVIFVQELEKALSSKDQEIFESYSLNKKKIESWLDISLEEHFLSWMSGEFAFTQSEPGLLGQEAELILVIKAKNIKDAKTKMDYIENKVKGRSPIKIKTVNYKEYPINYIEMKGFFRLFFGGIFDKFEKPYYTYIDDYVVFSNKPSSLLSFIEDYIQENTLNKNEGFKKSLSNSELNSTLFLFADLPKSFPLVMPTLTLPKQKELKQNKDALFKFPSCTAQLVSDITSSSINFTVNHQKEVSIINNIEDDEEDDALEGDANTEKKQLSELKKFYIEKFQGNILREFHENGNLKSETEIKNGQRHGRHREYYENGTMKVRGKYSKNLPQGTWKYYTEEGKFERKEKFK